MTTSQLEQVKAMSHDERVAKFKPMRDSGRIDLKQYIYVVSCIPYTQTHEESGTMGTDTRQTNDVRELEQAGSTTMDSSGERCEQTQQPVGGERTITGMEFVDSLSLPVVADGTVRTKPDHTVEDTGTSQKQRLLTLLADYEWHSTPQIQIAVYGANHLGIARVAARINDLKNDGHDIESKKITQAIWSYRLVEKGMRCISENVGSG